MAKNNRSQKLIFMNGEKQVQAYEIWRFLATSSYIDTRIKSLEEQSSHLNELEERIFGGKKVKAVQGISRELMQDLQNDIKENIDKLLGQKRDLLCLMEMMPNSEMRTVLSLRYLNSQRWEDVAKTMNRPLWDVFGIHSKIIEFLENKFSY
jgi:hypothetical protein